MAMNEENMKKWEDTYRSKLDNNDETLTQTDDKAKEQTENSLKQEQINHLLLF